ncbi:Zinc finger MYND domain-containing protein 12 [Larimichthys crocea]|uniref:Uncharacterized protein n=1 Tax=Larimichthys crocea TaxID=215358 RepID=A0ACD3R9T6_LARCR|nr:Zinc finger MYND domain-containing protein 12 [Larimichthys crocea]
MEAKPEVLGTTSEIIPLALPKGTEKLCELCERRANLQCAKCRVTFYCDADHQQADWVGIHERICQLLVPIRMATLWSLQQEGQIEMQLKKLELIEICRLVAQSKLSEGKHQEALPAAQFCLRCSKDVHGPTNVEMVPAYLLLAEANLGMGNLAVVAELLSQAEWAVLKSPECGHGVQHWLHRSLGQLHMATGNLEAALLYFANDIYFASEEYGLDSTVTCNGYFLMADVFAKQGKMPIVRSLYSENDSRKDSAQIALVAHCLAMLWFLGGDFLKALGFCSTALQASQLIPNHDLTEPIQALLQLVQGLHTEPHPGSD